VRSRSRSLDGFDRNAPTEWASRPTSLAICLFDLPCLARRIISNRHLILPESLSLCLSKAAMVLSSDPASGGNRRGRPDLPAGDLCTLVSRTRLIRIVRHMTKPFRQMHSDHLPAAIDYLGRTRCTLCGSRQSMLAEDGRFARAGAAEIRYIRLGLHRRCARCLELLWQGAAIWGASGSYGHHTLRAGHLRPGHVPSASVIRVRLRPDQKRLNCLVRVVVCCSCGEVLEDKLLKAWLSTADIEESPALLRRIA
jgi:hypothetical protein